MSLNIHRDDLLRQGSLIGEKIGFERGVVAGMSKGRNEGIAQGFSDGSRQAKLETAKLMRAHNYPIAEVCEMTGLSKQEVESL